MRAASRASSRNIATKRPSSARCGRIRLITSIGSPGSAPRRRARKISAIPPVASRARSSYFPKDRAPGGIRLPTAEAIDVPDDTPERLAGSLRAADRLHQLLPAHRRAPLDRALARQLVELLAAEPLQIVAIGVADRLEHRRRCRSADRDRPHLARHRSGDRPPRALELVAQAPELLGPE